MKENQNEKTYLAHKRTELAHERTVLAYFRTVASLFLFGIALIGFSQQPDIFFYGGWVSLILGLFFLIVAIKRFSKHNKEIKNIRIFFKSINRRVKKRKK